MNQENEIQNKSLFTKKELILISAFILIISVVSSLFLLSYNYNPDTVKTFNLETTQIKYEPALILFALIISLVSGIALLLFSLFGRIREEKPQFSLKNSIIFGILFILGIVAFIVLVVFCRIFSLHVVATFIISGILFNIYIYLIIKMYFFDYINDKRIFFELVRFAIVGVIASLFDLGTRSLVSLGLPKVWNAFGREVIYVTCGFIVGVVVNYLCSVYMVFKATSSKDISKTTKGRILFVVLSAVGLFMSYGLNYLFIDVSHLGFFTSFILQTAVVLIWNYLSRKYIIFR